MNTLTVLVVDDEFGMRSGAERSLQNFSFHDKESDSQVSFKIEAVDRGEAALEILRSSPADIVLLDYKLPGISGIEVLENLPETAQDTLIIIMTAYASIDTAVQATKRGAYDFLPKPFTPQELRYTVQKAATRVMLQKKARRLDEERKRVRFDFIRVLGHELKAPLGAVESYLGLMGRQILGEALPPYQHMIDSSLQRLEQMRKLIADLLDMTRIESGQLQRQPLDLNLRDLAAQSLELLQTLADEKEIRLSLNCQPEIPFRGDKTELGMILNNLISNAIKYNRPQGEVEVSLALAGSTAVLRVQDTGIGMSEEEQKRIFGEFSRIKTEKTKGILGNGLGLSIVKRLVDLNNGEIAVESIPDQGTTFTVRLQPNYGQPKAETA